MSRAIVIIILIVFVTGFIFWDDIFTDDSEGDLLVEDSPVVEIESEPGTHNRQQEKPLPSASDFQRLLNEGKWAAALQQLEGRTSPSALGAKHLCLLRLERFEESEQVLKQLVQSNSSSPASSAAILRSVEVDRLPAKERRKRLSKISGAFASFNPQQARTLVKVVKEINAQLPNSIQGMIQAEKYEVVSNDNLWDICQKYNKQKSTPFEPGLLCLLNGIQANKIYPGQQLVIPKDKINIKIWRNNWMLVTFVGDVLLSAYNVGLGKEGCTPSGEFLIKTRLEKPDWYSEQHGKMFPYGDPDNILGTRWLGFDNRANARGLGIHGTQDPGSIGKNMSSGCVRLANEDVEELFEIIARGTSVKVM